MMTEENTLANYETTWLNFRLEKDRLIVSEKNYAGTIPYGKGLRKSPLILPLSELKNVTLSYAGDGRGEYDGPVFRCRLRFGFFKSFLISNIIIQPRGGYIRRDEKYRLFLSALKDAADRFGVKTVGLKNLPYFLGKMPGWLSAGLIYVFLELLDYRLDGLLELLFDFGNVTGFVGELFLSSAPFLLAGGIWLGGRQLIDKLMPGLGKKEIPSAFLPAPENKELPA